jgi:hypothetical protein
MSQRSRPKPIGAAISFQDDRFANLEDMIVIIREKGRNANVTLVFFHASEEPLDKSPTTQELIQEVV